MRSACAGVVADDDPEPTTEPTTEPAATTTPAPEPAPTRSRPPLLGTVAVAVLVVAVTLGALWLTRDPPRSDAGTDTQDTGEAVGAPTTAPDAPSTTTGPKGCPVNEDVRAGTTTLVPGDGSEFAGDITIEDCSTQPRGRSVVKTWAFENTGSVEWTGRYLHRIDEDDGSPDCRAPVRVPIPDTEPGETVQVSVTVATPDRPATCFARWMQTDSEGNFTFPEQRPYYYTFTVE